MLLLKKEVWLKFGNQANIVKSSNDSYEPVKDELLEPKQRLQTLNNNAPGVSSYLAGRMQNVVPTEVFVYYITPRM